MKKTVIVQLLKASRRHCDSERSEDEAILKMRLLRRPDVSSGLLAMTRWVFFLLLFVNSIAWAQSQYTAGQMRDPFASQLPEDEKKKDLPVGKKEPLKLPVIVVSSIISGGNIPQAIIKGKIVRIGDTVEGAVITNITKEGVSFLFEYETFTAVAPSRLLKYQQGGNNVK